MSNNNLSKAQIFFKEAFLLVLGSAIFALSVSSFAEPNKIVPGGVSGLSILINSVTSIIPVGQLYWLLNIPLLIWGAIGGGWKFISKTLFVTFFSGGLIDLFGAYIPAYTNNMMGSAIFAGIFSGVGLGLIFLSGATSGGTDLVANLVGKKLKHIPVGQILFFIDFLVVLTAVLVQKNIDQFLYASITIFLCAKLIDTILYGFGNGTGKVMFIASEKNKIIEKSIMDAFGRGITELRSRGGYSGIDGEVLLCVVRRNEVAKVYKMISEIDDTAFIVVAEASEVTGHGFKHVSEHL